MEPLLLSYHSISVFVPLLMLAMMSVFLFVTGKTRTTRWLAFAYVGFWVMVLGYFVSYSWFAPEGAFHRWLTVCVLFGQAAIITFGYYYPRPDRPKEAAVMIPVVWVLSVVGWGLFAFGSWKLEPYYDFEAHLYSFHLGKVTSYFIMFDLVWWLTLFWRKTVRYSMAESGNKWSARPQRMLSLDLFRFFAARAWLTPYSLVRPRGKDAISCRGFFLAGVLMLMIGVFNTANKTGRMPYDVYASVYSVLTLITVFGMFIVYINNSPEPSTFMVKLVGISLFTLLLVLGFVSDYALNLNESAYNRERMAEVVNSRNEILSGQFDSLPQGVKYVLKRAEKPGLFHEADHEIVFARAGSVTRESLRMGEERMRRTWMELRRERLKAIDRKLKSDRVEALALEQAQAETAAFIGAAGVPEDKVRRYRDAGTYFTHFDFLVQGQRYEVGFSYLEYRKYVHRIAAGFVYVIIIATLLISLLFPLFFRSSLVSPLNWLLDGVKKVNEGDLAVQVPVKVQDEIGFLARSFNAMVVSIREAHAKLEDYAHNLEHKVEERTREVREKMEEVQRLKVQQDGDYFLTSLLATPLFYNANKSARVSTQFLIQQKKKFEFREREGDLGGDICVSGNLRLGTSEHHRRFIVAMNGDAMGKSMQGAGGSLVMGVMMNSIMARSAAGNRILDISPEQWLTDVYNELHGVFRSFDGSMVISATLFVVEEQTGEAWYWNAEHPHTVRLRGGTASFIEEELRLRKLGLDSEFPFEVFRTQLEEGDVLILGSDGKDDLNLEPGSTQRVMNEDEFLILKFVEQGAGDLERIVELVLNTGEITDDLSFLRIGFHEAHAPIRRVIADDAPAYREAIEIDAYAIEEFYEHAKDLYQAGDLDQALSVLKDGYAIDHSNMKLNKLLGLLSFKGRDYEKAVQVLNRYLDDDPELPQSLMYLSLAEKKLGNLESALSAATRLLQLEPRNVKNLINLADISRLIGDTASARRYSDEAAALDPGNQSVEKLRGLLATPG